MSRSHSRPEKRPRGCGGHLACWEQDEVSLTHSLCAEDFYLVKQKGIGFVTSCLGNTSPSGTEQPGWQTVVMETVRACSVLSGAGVPGAGLGSILRKAALWVVFKPRKPGQSAGEHGMDNSRGFYSLRMNILTSIQGHWM